MVHLVKLSMYRGSNSLFDFPFHFSSLSFYPFRTIHFPYCSGREYQQSDRLRRAQLPEHVHISTPLKPISWYSDLLISCIGYSNKLPQLVSHYFQFLRFCHVHNQPNPKDG